MSLILLLAVYLDIFHKGVAQDASDNALNASVPQPFVQLRIVTVFGESSPYMKVGERLCLLIEKEKGSTTPFDIFARNLVAHSSAENDDEAGDKLELIDGKGCPTERNFGPMEKMNDTGNLLAEFDAFKFPGSSVVNFRVSIKFCLGKCRPANCGFGVFSYGRKRRSPSNFVILAEDVVLWEKIAIEEG